MRGLLHTAGERVELRCAVPWIADVLTEGAAGQLTADDNTAPDIRVTVERGSAAFDVTGWRVLTRGAWVTEGQMILRDACSSGLDLRVTAGEPTLDVVARWRPSGKGRAAAAVLRARARLLIRAVLLQYPALWWGQQRGRAPLHASVCGLGTADGQTVLLAGPGGVGKSTLVYGELLHGAVATCDNLCVSDGRYAWGVVEPLRLPAVPHRGRGRRMPHGRREAAWPRRSGRMLPDRLVVLTRGGGRAVTTPCAPAWAARSLVAGTYMAGELRRYWAFAATLALGTGMGSSHPPVQDTADTLSTRLPCLQVTLGEDPGAPLRELLSATAVTGVPA
ncbi:MAG TPA: hypothetical protein VED20_12005 [Streptosporangiaceae bacterium]|nr:hypothetical protein [Streptosporangiaceae bacterium]